MAILGLLLRRDVGVLLVGLVWPLALLAGLVMALLLLGLGFGWPLMWATISTEGTDSFDALSRTYAYVFQRPLRYLFYVLVAGVIGWLGWLLVQTFAGAVISLSFWAAGWGTAAFGSTNSDSVLPGRRHSLGRQQDHPVLGLLRRRAGHRLLLWILLDRLVGHLLAVARDVDATETDEVFLDADKSEPEHGLPTLGSRRGRRSLRRPSRRRTV